MGVQQLIEKLPVGIVLSIGIYQTPIEIVHGQFLFLCPDTNRNP